MAWVAAPNRALFRGAKFMKASGNADQNPCSWLAIFLVMQRASRARRTARKFTKRENA
jgi:hypothetical protein